MSRDLRQHAAVWLGAFMERAGLTADDDEPVRYDKISSYLEELGRNTVENRIWSRGFWVAGPPDSIGAAATPQLLKRAQFEFIVSLVKQAASARPGSCGSKTRTGWTLIGRTAAGHRGRLGAIALFWSVFDDAAISQGTGASRH